MVLGPRRRRLPGSVPLAILAATLGLGLATAAPALALLELRFVSPPALPALPAVTLNGASQTVSTAMTNFSIEYLNLSGGGWNLTAQGQTGTGVSPVFAQYCPKTSCGSSPEGYVAGGSKLPAGSLTLNTTGASFGGGLLAPPSFTCSAGCALDSAAPVKIVSQGTGVLIGEGIWTSKGFSANSLSLAAPATMLSPPTGEVYRVNILWTLSSGP